MPDRDPSDAGSAGGVATPPAGAEREAVVAELGRAFRHAFRSLRSLRGRDTHREDDIGHAQLELLVELYVRGPLHAGELAEAVGVSAATVSGMLDRLCEADLAERSRSEADRRIVDVRLTRRGRRKVEARKAVWQRRWQEAMEGLDDEELRTASRVLERVGGIFAERDA